MAFVNEIITDKTTYEVDEIVTISVTGDCSPGPTEYLIYFKVSKDQANWETIYIWSGVKWCNWYGEYEEEVVCIWQFDEPGEWYIGAFPHYGDALAVSKIFVRHDFPPGTGELYVTSTPQAQVDIDGIYRGMTPVGTMTNAGSHSVKVYRVGYNTINDTVKVLDGQVVEQHYTMKEVGEDEEDWVMELLPWIIGGVLVVAGSFIFSTYVASLKGGR
jgi:hypothetical protein